ncbi:MAG: sulfite exporter TauE/SafE family protein [Saprospiraceae bacterium]
MLLFLVAFLYSSVGHGGASGYLALMAFFSFAPETMWPTALMLNIFVSLIAFIQYYRSGHFKWQLFWPFAIASIPAAFIGGLIVVDAKIYKTILGVLLLFPVVRLGGVKFNAEETQKEQKLFTSLIIGALIGLFSGMIGIGGGIILSPIILLLHWANMKQTAAVSALFILVNSMAGLAGLSQRVLISGLKWCG